MSQDHRDAFRLPFASKGICRMDGGNVLIGKLRDISKNGCFIETPISSAVLGNCEVEFVLNGRLSFIRILHVKGEVIRSDENGIAINFTAPFEWIPLVPLSEAKVKSIADSSPARPIKERSPEPPIIEKSLEPPIKIFVVDDKARVVCPHCRLAKEISVEQIRQHHRFVNVNCKCGVSFELELEFRAHRRKNTNLEGTFKSASGNWPASVMNLSMNGGSIELHGSHNLQPGNKGTAGFTLDDRKQSLIVKKVIIRNIKGNRMGCEFISDGTYQKELGFYLMS